jgi:hypothetical protein
MKDTQEGFSAVSDKPVVEAVSFTSFKIQSFLHYFLVFFATDLDVTQSYALFILCK